MSNLLCLNMSFLFLFKFRRKYLEALENVYSFMSDKEGGSYIVEFRLLNISKRLFIMSCTVLSIML